MIFEVSVFLQRIVRSLWRVRLEGHAPHSETSKTQITMKTWLLYVLLWVGGSAATPTEREVKVVGNTYGSVLVGDTVEVKYRPDIENSDVLSEDICLHVQVIHRKTKQLSSDREFSFLKSIRGYFY